MSTGSIEADTEIYEKDNSEEDQRVSTICHAFTLHVTNLNCILRNSI